MKLIEQYDSAIARGEITSDPLQRDVVSLLQGVADEIAATPRHSWFKLGRKKPVLGLYLHGPVGVGKTYLVDLFYQHVDEKQKSRFHFHQFMQQIDAQLRQIQGQKDPLLRIAAKLAKKTRLLCFDEFLVYDVADAMILSELIKALFAHDIILVATSNTAPDDLYLNGVQRDRFLPVIDLIKEHCHVFVLTDYCDYRLGRAPLHQAYVYPLDDAAKRCLTSQFATISNSGLTENVLLSVQNREIFCVKCSQHAVWFTFDVICNLPRSQLDYLEIADRFDTVFVSEIPILTQDNTTQALLLMNFIDVLYDRGIRLVVSAAVPIDQLYVTGEIRPRFQRTLSRMEEMQSKDYLHRHQRRHIQSM